MLYLYIWILFNLSLDSFLLELTGFFVEVSSYDNVCLFEGCIFIFVSDNLAVHSLGIVLCISGCVQCTSIIVVYYLFYLNVLFRLIYAYFIMYSLWKWENDIKIISRALAFLLDLILKGMLIITALYGVGHVTVREIGTYLFQLSAPKTLFKFLLFCGVSVHILRIIKKWLLSQTLVRIYGVFAYILNFSTFGIISCCCICSNFITALKSNV